MKNNIKHTIKLIDFYSSFVEVYYNYMLLTVNYIPNPKTNQYEKS